MPDQFAQLINSYLASELDLPTTTQKISALIAESPFGTGRYIPSPSASHPTRPLTHTQTQTQDSRTSGPYSSQPQQNTLSRHPSNPPSSLSCTPLPPNPAIRIICPTLANRSSKHGTSTSTTTATKDQDQGQHRRHRHRLTLRNGRISIRSLRALRKSESSRLKS